jgi:hypothetical protein
MSSELPSRPLAASVSDDTKEAAAASDEADSASSLLYDDVDAVSPSSLFAVKHAYELQQLRAELAETLRQQQEMAGELERKEAECARYRAQCAVLARNVSLLYATAVSEVKRKNEEIDRLQAWKEAQERRDRQRRQEAVQHQQQQTPAAPQPPNPPPLLLTTRPAPRLAALVASSLPMPPPPRPAIQSLQVL